MPWVWADEASAIHMHDAAIHRHGGLPGIRDQGALQSALARPANLEAYKDPDIADLAAAYAYGIIRNHPFADGNKRTAYAVAVTFLRNNGADLIGATADHVALLLRVADRSLDERQLAAELRARLAPYRP
jgi:death-on-curing protein